MDLIQVLTKLLDVGLLLAVDLNLRSMPDWKVLEKVCEEALLRSKMHVVDRMFHKFVPQGETSIWLLAESHMAVHTYPEKNFIALDIITCGNEGEPYSVVDYFREKLDVVSYSINIIPRGRTL